MWAPKKGDWTPGLQDDLSVIAMCALAIEVLIRGLDYLTGDREDVTQSLTVVEQTMSLQAWGVILLVGASTFLGGMVLRRFGLVIFGAVISMATYSALTVGLFIRMADRGWPWDGYRTPLTFAVIALFFGLIAFSAYLKKAAFDAESSMQNGGATPRLGG